MAGAPAKPVTVCAGLALALHAVLLWPHAFPAGASSSGGPVAMAVRVMVEQAAPAPVAVAEPDVPSPPATTMTAPPARDTPPGPVDVVEAAPVFTEGMPEIALPDAALPPTGVQLRAWVSLGVDGLPVAVTASASDAEAPPAFRKTAERALMQAHFKPQDGAVAYCLLVSFEPESNAARLAWLPGAARDAARCLAGPAPKPRDIELAASAAG